MLFSHSNMFIYNNFKLYSYWVLNSLGFFKPNIFIWFVLQSSVWHSNHWNGMFYISISKSKKMSYKDVLGVRSHIRFLCKFKPTYSEFLIRTTHHTDPEANTRKCYMNGKHIGYPNGWFSPEWVNQSRG